MTEASPTAGRTIRVLFLQPVIPHYRLAFFEGLARVPGLNVQVHASPRIPQFTAPDSVAVGDRFPHLLHPCRALLGGRLFWQQELAVPAGWGAGDVLIVPGGLRFLSTFPLLGAARRRGLGVIWASHGWTAGGSHWSFAVKRGLMRLADVVLLYTQAEVEEYRQRGFPAARLFGMNNTVDVSAASGALARWSPARVAAFVAEQGLAPEEQQLLFCGRLTAKTGLPVLFEALRWLGPSHRLVIIGDGEQRPALEQRARQLGVADRIRWTGSLLDPERLAPWYCSSACFVYPGAIGLSLLQAFGYGLPVITHANRRNQMPEIAALEPEVNGLLFRDGDPADLARQIRRLTSDQALRGRMATAALRTVREEYTIPHMVSRVAEAIRACSHLSQQRGGG